MTDVQGTYRTALRKGLPGQIANSELSNRISRTVETAAGIPFGQPAFRGSGDHGVIAGATFAATGAGSAAAGNVGTSTITASPTITAGAKQGRYSIIQLATSATGALAVYDPDGVLVGHGVVGTAITTIPGITTFTVTSGGTATIGDTFYIDTTFTANAAFVGLAILDPGAIVNTTTPDGYAQYQTGSFETTGPMYVTAGASVNDGDQVYWNPATGRYTNTVTHIRLPNVRFDTTGVDGGIVEISIRNRNA